LDKRWRFKIKCIKNGFIEKLNKNNCPFDKTIRIKLTKYTNECKICM